MSRSLSWKRVAPDDIRLLSGNTQYCGARLPHARVERCAFTLPPSAMLYKRPLESRNLVFRALQSRTLQSRTLQSLCAVEKPKTLTYKWVMAAIT